MAAFKVAIPETSGLEGVIPQIRGRVDLGGDQGTHDLLLRLYHSLLVTRDIFHRRLLLVSMAATLM